VEDWMAYTMVLSKGNDKKKISIVENFFDQNAPGILIVKVESGDFLYVNLKAYDFICIDGKGLAMAQAEMAKAGNNGKGKTKQVA